MDTDRIFDITTSAQFDSLALEIFGFQFQNNPVYRQFCIHLGKSPKNVFNITEIPFLPIEFFKSKKVVSSTKVPDITFSSSGTSGGTVSKHYVADAGIYQKSYLKGFGHFYGNVGDYCILALLPSYLERGDSSLVYMVDGLIKKSGHPVSGFYLDETEKLLTTLKELNAKGEKILLLGVSFALLDMTEKNPLNLKNTIIMETGGMKGRRKEMIREELHAILKNGFGVDTIHSEYGMTELLSQAYSKGGGIFKTPPWMKVLIRDTEDPLILQKEGKTGGVNVIDLANLYSCSFIATQDLGKLNSDNTCEILGRFDNSDIRGCNLMVL